MAPSVNRPLKPRQKNLTSKSHTRLRHREKDFAARLEKQKKKVIV